MESIDVTQIVAAFLAFIATVVTGFLIPYIKQKTTNAEYDSLMFWVKLAVQAAEQIYNESGQGEKKKIYVLSYLKSKGFTLDEKELDNAIESAVYEINKAVKSG